MTKPMTNKEASSLQEHRVASALNWQVTSGSGARAFYPGDIVSDAWLGECKTHVAITPVIFYWSVWNKINDEAASQFKRPVLFVDNGSQALNKTWCMTNTKLDYTGTVSLLPESCINAQSIRLNNKLDDRVVYQYPDKDIYFMSFNLFKELVV